MVKISQKFKIFFALLFLVGLFFSGGTNVIANNSDFSNDITVCHPDFSNIAPSNLCFITHTVYRPSIIQTLHFNGHGCSGQLPLVQATRVGTQWRLRFEGWVTCSGPVAC